MKNGMYINEFGTKEWYVNGLLHREDGPAVINADGSQEWWIDGLCHREDGPAIVYANGRQEWWLNGKPNDVNECFLNIHSKHRREIIQ